MRTELEYIFSIWNSHTFIKAFDLWPYGFM